MLDLITSYRGVVFTCAEEEGEKDTLPSVDSQEPNSQTTAQK